MSKRGNCVLFDYFKKNQDDTKRAECNVCKKQISYKTTITNLKQHLKLKHVGIFNEFISRSLSRPKNRPAPVAEAALSQRQGSVNNDGSGGTNEKNGGENIHTSNNACAFIGEGAFNNNTKTITAVAGRSVVPPRQRKMASYRPRSLRQYERKKINKALLKLMTVDFQPFSVVEDVGFKEFVTALNPSYEMPNKKTLSNSLLSKEYNEHYAEIQALVRQSCSSICVTIDCWTSKNMETYMAVTGHFINKENLEFHSFLLQCAGIEEQHTGDRLASELRQIFNEWNIYDKVNLIVSDNAPNMVAATRILQKNHYGCYAHKLNLIVKDALDDEEISCTISKVQKTASHFKRSTIAKERLLKYQTTAQSVPQPRNVLLSVPNRWNSVYHMLERFVSLQEALRATIPNLNTKLPVIPMEEWVCIRQICEVLKPFEQVTTIMSSENYLLASNAVVLTAGLNTVCDELLLQVNLHNPVKKLLKKLKDGLITRFGNIEQNETIAICTLLDPRFKHYAFENEAAIFNAKLILKEKISALYVQDVAQEIILQSSPEWDIPNTSTGISLWGKFEQKLTTSHQPKTVEEKADEEINMYWSQTVVPRSECPIKWWREHKFMYPKLYETFISSSNIVVTSVPCERIFSKAGYMISDRRSRLTTSKVKKLLFLNSSQRRKKLCDCK